MGRWNGGMLNRLRFRFRLLWSFIRDASVVLFSLPITEALEMQEPLNELILGVRIFRDEVGNRLVQAVHPVAHEGESVP